MLQILASEPTGTLSMSALKDDFFVYFNILIAFLDIISLNKLTKYTVTLTVRCYVSWLANS